jgi:hypothetical protein
MPKKSHLNVQRMNNLSKRSGSPPAKRRTVNAGKENEMQPYRWTTPKKGQYADGHEREDVVTYRNKVFLPKWQQMETQMRNWSGGMPEFGGSLPEFGSTYGFFPKIGMDYGKSESYGFFITAVCRT